MPGLTFPRSATWLPLAGEDALHPSITSRASGQASLVQFNTAMRVQTDEKGVDIDELVAQEEERQGGADESP